MRKVLVLALAVFLAAGFAAAATPAGAQEYDRYERGTAAPPPPPAQPPPVKYKAVPPPPRPAGFHAGPYLTANIGLFEPNSYSDGLAQYSSDWSGNIAIGSRVSPFAAIEGGVGYYTANTGSNEVSVVPVTIGGRLIIPSPVFELYFGGGIGAYFASLKEPVQVSPLIGTDDSNTTIGGYVSFGLDWWVSPKVALNLDTRYQMASPTFTSSTGISYDVDVSGWELNFGVRVNF
jgi:opacity protein-like surface antigen